MANIFKSKYTGEQIEDILDKANNVTDITPNPEAEATEELQKITIGNTTFSIPKGVTVEGNPSEDATVELTKLKVGDTIYSIPQGSGGGGTPLYRHSISLTTPFSSNSDVYSFISEESDPYTVYTIPVTGFMCRSLEDFDEGSFTSYTRHNVYVFIGRYITTPRVEAYYINNNTLTPCVYSGSFTFEDTVTAI